MRIKSHGQISILQTTIIIAAVTFVLSVTFAVYKKWWPWLMRNTDMALYEAANDSDIRLFSIIIDNLERIYFPHALRLLEFERNNVSFDSINLKDLASLPGVKDAFRIDFQRHLAMTESGTLSSDILLAFFNRPKDSKVKRGGAAQMMRRTVGGQNHPLFTATG